MGFDVHVVYEYVLYVGKIKKKDNPQNKEANTLILFT